LEQEILKKIEEQGLKIDAIYASVEKTRKYFSMMIWITVLVVVVPMIALAFILPSFLSNYTSTLVDMGL
jgi:type IV secretory pathway component VirB8